ncbi:hypothetical protein [Pseudomonas aeruginosa]|uniref:hypothetical protein n=1 Tax=Pseudomonas aeruginosa TaxID=287 RepID=UPI003D2C7C6E
MITPEQIDFLAEVASEGIDIATRDAVSVAVSDFHPDHRDPGLNVAAPSFRGGRFPAPRGRQ